MQTIPAPSLRILAWEQIDLPNGVYQVRNARWLDEMPDITGWLDCTGWDQWADEVDVALGLLGEIRQGIWVGVGNTVSGVCHGLAWMV